MNLQRYIITSFPRKDDEEKVQTDEVILLKAEDVLDEPEHDSGDGDWWFILTADGEI
jgi:hypothetical protein